MDYTTAKIYRLHSPSTGLNYIGSTCNDLRTRLQKHKGHYKQYLNDRRRYISSYEVVKQPDCVILLVEAKACNDKLEMLRLEAHHMNNYKCVNKNKPGALLLAGGKKQYMDEYNPLYRQNNLDAIRAKKNKKNECLCGGRYTQQNKAQHEKTALHQLYLRLIEHNELNHLANL